MNFKRFSLVSRPLFFIVSAVMIAGNISGERAMAAEPAGRNASCLQAAVPCAAMKGGGQSLPAAGYQTLANAGITGAPAQAAPAGIAGAPVQAKPAGATETKERDNITAYGTAAPAIAVTLAARAAGVIEYIVPMEGMKVSSGEVVLTVEKADYLIRSHLSKAQLSAARVAREQSAREQKRIRQLFEASAATAQASDNMEFARRAQEANFEAASAQCRLAERSLDDTSVLAPISGIVTTRYSERGNFTDKGKPVLEIVNIDRIKMRMKVPETQIAFVRPGKPVDISSEAYPGRSFSAMVESVIPSGDPLTHSFDVVVMLDNPGHAIMPGMFLKGTVAREAAEINSPVSAVPAPHDRSVR